MVAKTQAYPQQKVSNMYRLTLLGSALVVCIFFVFYINVRHGLEVVYTHFFYLPIILAGIWYYKKAAFVALALGAVHIYAGYLVEGTIVISTIVRAGVFVSVALVVGQISEKKDLLCQELSISTRQNNLILQAAAEGIVSIDLQGFIIFANPAAFRMLGCQLEEISLGNLNLFSLLRPVEPTNADQENLLRNSLNGNQSPSTGIGSLTTMDGKNLIVEYNCTSVGDQVDRLSVAVVVLRDITERLRVENEMVRLEKLNLIGKLAASLAHELRNPMTTVRGFLQLSLDKKNSFNSEHVTLMIEELDHANAIITEFLSLGKKPMTNPQLQSLNTVVTAVSQLMVVGAANNGKQVKITFGELPDFRLDAGEIRQLLFNLVNNALEATPDGGEVSIRTYLEGQAVFLAVQDQGQGIAEDVLDRLGTPFLTTKESGTGLGLAVCYSIAVRHNATITVQSDATGTTFLVKFQLGQH